MQLLILAIVVLLVLGGEGWGYRSGYYGGGAFGVGLGVVVLIVLAVLRLGR